MNNNKLKELQNDENERASIQIENVGQQYQKKGMSWAVQEIYSDKIKLPSGHAYHQCGSLGMTTFLNEKVIVEMFPYKDPSALYAGTGLTVNQIVILAKEGILEILIHSYPAYEGLDYLDPVLELKPAAYQTRGKAFLNAISNGRFDEWFERGTQSKYLRLVNYDDFVQEPYEKGRDFPMEEIKRKTIWRYAAMCCLIGQEVVDLVVETHREKAANYINELHTVFLHPITHGMVGDPFSSVMASRDIHDPRYIKILDSLERIMVEEIGLALPKNISAKSIVQSHKQGVAKEFTSLRKTLFRDLIKDLANNIITAEGASLRLREQLNELNEKINLINAAEKKIETGLVLGLLAGGTVCLSQGYGTLSALLFGGTQAVPYILEPLAKSYSRIFDPAVSHYWNLRDVGNRIKK